MAVQQTSMQGCLSGARVGLTPFFPREQGKPLKETSGASPCGLGSPPKEALEPGIKSYDWGRGVFSGFQSNGAEGHMES